MNFEFWNSKCDEKAYGRVQQLKELLPPEVLQGIKSPLLLAILEYYYTSSKRLRAKYPKATQMLRELRKDFEALRNQQESLLECKCGRKKLLFHLLF